MEMELNKIIEMCEKALDLAEESYKKGKAFEELKAIKDTEKLINDIIQTDEMIIRAAENLIKMEMMESEIADLTTIKNLRNEIKQTKQHQEQKQFELFSTAVLKEAFHVILEGQTGIAFIF